MPSPSPLYINPNTLRRRVTWVRLRHPFDLFGIERLGGPGWEASRREVAQDIDNGSYRYFTHVGIYEANLTTFTMHGEKYVRTRSDTTLSDNLLQLERR